MAGQRNELPRTGIPAVTASAAGLWDSAPAEGAPGTHTHRSRSEPQRLLLALGPSGRQSPEEDQSRARSRLRPPDFSRKGRGGEMCSDRELPARARTPPQRKETDPTGASTHVAPAPGHRPPSPPLPHLPTCRSAPRCQKSAPSCWTPWCRRAPRSEAGRDARLVQGLRAQRCPRPAPPGPAARPPPLWHLPRVRRGSAARGARLCSSFFSSSESPPSRPFAARAVLPERGGTVRPSQAPPLPAPPRRPHQTLDIASVSVAAPERRAGAWEGWSTRQPKVGNADSTLGHKHRSFREVPSVWGPTRAEHKEWILMTLRSGRSCRAV